MSELTPLDDEILTTNLTLEDAKALTHHIRSSFTEGFRGLFRAQQEHIWIAYRYRTWADYVSQELSMSESMAKRLLTQGAVTAQIEQVANVVLPPGTLTARGAKRLKPKAQEVAEKVRNATAGKRGEKRVQAAVKVIANETNPRYGDKGAGQGGSRATPAMIECPHCHGSGRVPRPTTAGRSPTGSKAPEAVQNCRHAYRRRDGSCVACGHQR